MDKLWFSPLLWREYFVDYDPVEEADQCDWVDAASIKSPLFYPCCTSTGPAPVPTAVVSQKYFISGYIYSIHSKRRKLLLFAYLFYQNMKTCNIDSDHYCRGSAIPSLIFSLLLICALRHGGHVGGQEQKHFSPVATKVYFLFLYFLFSLAPKRAKQLSMATILLCFEFFRCRVDVLQS